MGLIAAHPPIAIPAGSGVAAVEGERGPRRVGFGFVLLTSDAVRGAGAACEAACLPDARAAGLRAIGERAASLGLTRIRVLVDDPRLDGLCDRGGGAVHDRSCSEAAGWISGMAGRGLSIRLLGMPGRTGTDGLAARMLELARSLAKTHDGTVEASCEDGWLDRIARSHPRLAPAVIPDAQAATLGRAQAAWWFGVAPSVVDELYRRGHLDIDPGTGGVRRAGAMRVFSEAQRLRWPDLFDRWG